MILNSEELNMTKAAEGIGPSSPQNNFNTINSDCLTLCDHKATKVALFILGVIFLASGGYAALQTPQWWAGYALMGCGIVAFALDATLVFSQKIVEEIRPSSPPSNHYVPPSYFHISHLLSYDEFWAAPECIDARGHPIPSNLFSFFEANHTPFLRAKDEHGNQSLYLGFSVYNTKGEWIEDNVIYFFQAEGKWQIVTYPLQKINNFFFMLQSSCEASSSQTQWLQKLARGERVPLANVLFDKTICSSDYVCKLWQPPAENEEHPISQLFGKRKYLSENLLKIDTKDLFFYNPLQYLIRNYYNWCPIMKGRLKYGDHFYLVQFRCFEENNPRLLLDHGYLFFWQDCRNQNWKIHLRLSNELNNRFKFSSEVVEELEPKEIDLLKTLIGEKTLHFPQVLVRVIN